MHLPCSSFVYPHTTGRQHAGHLKAVHPVVGRRLQVATPGLQRAHHYVWTFCQNLQQQAEGSDVVVQAQFENYTGSFNFDFVGERFINGGSPLPRSCRH